MSKCEPKQNFDFTASFQDTLQRFEDLSESRKSDYERTAEKERSYTDRDVKPAMG